MFATNAGTTYLDENGDLIIKLVNNNPSAVAPVETSMDISSKFKYEAPKYSVTVIRIGRR